MSPRVRRNPVRGRAGLTLVELLISLVILGLIASVTLAFMGQQEQAFSWGTGRMAASQNHSFALTTLERNLRTMGTNVPTAQPVIVYAGEDVIAFSADYMSNDPHDLFAVYIEPNAPAGAVQALTSQNRIQVPQTDMMYPDTSYVRGGINSPAETIVFFFAPDPPGQTTRHVLYRQVNAQRPEVVARNLERTGELPFFEYHKLTVPESGPTRLDAIPRAALPLRHSAAIHGSPADTGRSALTDSIRTVRVNLTATSRYGGIRQQTRDVSRTIRLPNAGVEARVSCGEPPQLGVSLQASRVGQSVRLRWNPAIDEYGGEQDVLRYIIWRRKAGQSDWGIPYTSMPGGNTSYEHFDDNVEPGNTYFYALAAQDCTPAMSALATSQGVSIN